MPIALLSPEVSSLIAAGEVIDRPSSVVKELIENALDAGADSVHIRVRGGGIDLIQVNDNGTGIPSNEVALSIQRFATSKISGSDDLEAISTLGFRGEALASIAAVSNLSVVSRSASESHGSRIEVRDGVATDVVPYGAPQGTTLSVRKLFHNLPARLKFLSTAASESSRIRRIVTRYALAYPWVRFRLDQEKSASFSTSGSGNLRDAMSFVFGLNTSQAMLEVVSMANPHGSDGPAVEGLITPPHLNRANRSYITFFVNRRWIQSRSLGVAIEHAFQEFMPERRYPITVLHLTVPYEDVDVNVHPGKTEVRFRKESEIFSVIKQAVRHTLIMSAPVPAINSIKSASRSASSDVFTSAFWPMKPFQGAPEGFGDGGVAGVSNLSGMDSNYEMEPKNSLGPADALPILRVIGQIHNTYVVAEGPDGVYLIDQHAAHERVVFENVRSKANSHTFDVQKLLEPVVADLSIAQWEVLEGHLDTFVGLGFMLESFGANAYLIRGLPAALSPQDPSTVLTEIIDSIIDGGGFKSWEDRAAYSLACHGSIRAGTTLNIREMTALVRQLENCKSPYACPHGRPTMIHLRSSQLEREFRRS